MGLLDRWATLVAGPPPATAPAPPTSGPIRPMTASGARVNLRSPALVHTKRAEWQNDAWGYRDSVDELRFAAEFVANSLGQLRVFAAENRSRGQDPVPLDPTGVVPDGITAAQGVDDHTRDCAVKLVDRLNLNQQGSHLLAQLAENFDIAGECYLLGEDGEEGEEWSVRSVSELQVTAGGATLLDPNGGGTGRQLRADQCEVLRLWNPHPRWQEWPDSPVAAMLGTLEGMVLLARRGRAHDRSRISSGQALYLPWEFSLMRAGDASEVDEDEDPAMAALSEAMMRPIDDEAAASAVVPVIIRGDAMIGDRPAADVIKTIQLHGENAGDLDDRYEALVRRLSRGINLAQERMTGLGQSNHWSGALITADEFKSHVRPRAVRIVDSLTQAYLWAGMRAMGVPREQRRRVCLWFDPSALVENPNRDDAAKDAHAAGVISDEALRDTLGFGEGDAPDERERLMRTLTDGRAYEASIPWVIGMSGLDLSDPVVQNAVRMVRQLGPAAPGGAARPVVDATPNRQGAPVPSQALDPAPSVSRQAPPAPSGVTAAAKGRGPRDDPTGPSVAGLALMAADTGRVLMLQRGLDDPDDPAAGTWEFPGGHVEPGDETSLHAAMREWSEEVGQPVPDGGTVVFAWTSPDGVYQGHAVVIAKEEALDLAAERTLSNPDDDAEQCAWWDPQDARRNPALRRECRRTPWSTLRKVVRTVRSPVTAAGAVRRNSETKFRVDEAACRRLAQIDRALTDRLLAHAEATVGRAVEKAAARVRGRAQKDPVLAAAFPKGSDPVAVCAASGRDVQGDVTDEQALAGALDELAVRWDRETEHAAEQAARVVTGMIGAQAAGGLLQRLVDGARRGWEWLRGRLARHITRVLYGEPDVDPVPTELVRGALTVAGGVPETSPGVAEDGAPARAPGQDPAPQAGLATGEATSSALRDGGAAALGWVWGYHGVARKDPFLPHRALDGRRFTGFNDPGLATSGADSWIGARYYPGDHQGCMCSIEMIWATPTGDEDRSSSVNRDVAALEETPQMRQIRELAEADDAAGRTGTSAQRDRDAAAEIAELRRRHIGAREGATA